MDQDSKVGKDNVVSFEDAKLMREAKKAITDMKLLFEEAAKYPDDPDAVAFIQEWSGKMKELSDESEALMKEIEELEKLEQT
jgi:hypothetical protein